MRSWRLRFRQNRRGLSEIVGTLMLIVIVVAAATLLSAWVATYEKSYLAEQSVAHDKSLEDLYVISIDPVLGPASNYTSINVTIGSIDPLTTSVTEVTLNGDPVAVYYAHAIGSSSSTEVCEECNVTLGIPNAVAISAQQQIVLNFNTSTNTPKDPTGGLAVPLNLTVNHYISISLFTQRGNEFTRSFYAPTAVEQISSTTVYTGGSYEEDLVVLNGLDSVSPPNTTVVEWSWDIYPRTHLLNESFTFPIPQAEVLINQTDFPVCPGHASYNCPSSYNFNLTVMDDDGLFDTVSVTYDGYVS